MSETPTEYVYLIGSKGCAVVKIGRSTDVPTRLAAIQYMSLLKLTMLWQTKGGAELEADLHRHFRAQRSHGEWFERQDARDRRLRGSLGATDMIYFALRKPDQGTRSGLRSRKIYS